MFGVLVCYGVLYYSVLYYGVLYYSVLYYDLLYYSAQRIFAKQVGLLPPETFFKKS